MESISDYQRPKRRFRSNVIEVSGVVATIVIGRFRVLIDADFVPIADQFTWACHSEACYAHAKSRRKNITLHRLVLNAPPGSIVDHQNRNIHDNRRGNLRLVTNSLNCRNHVVLPTSNVYFSKARQDWSVGFGVTLPDGTKRWENFGRFSTLEEAQAKAAEIRPAFLSGAIIQGNHRSARSGHRHVHPTENPLMPWCVHFTRKGKKIHIGRFATIEAAIVARDVALLEHDKE